MTFPMRDDVPGISVACRIVCWCVGPTRTSMGHRMAVLNILALVCSTMSACLNRSVDGKRNPVRGKAEPFAELAVITSHRLRVTIPVLLAIHGSGMAEI